MTVTLTPHAQRDYNGADVALQRKVDSTLTKALTHGLRYPGLGCKKLQGVVDLYEFRLSKKMRLILRQDAGRLVVLGITHHDGVELGQMHHWNRVAVGA